jgi:hypothetical protein
VGSSDHGDGCVDASQPARKVCEKVDRDVLVSLGGGRAREDRGDLAGVCWPRYAGPLKKTMICNPVVVDDELIPDEVTPDVSVGQRAGAQICRTA